MADAKKRVANTVLTHDNWDSENEASEEAGVFKTADKDELAKRQFKKAKRRTDVVNSIENKTSNPFSTFGGFGASKVTFNFGAKPTSTGTMENKIISTSQHTEKEAENNNTTTASFWQTTVEKKDFFASRGKQKTEIKNEVQVDHNIEDKKTNNVENNVNTKKNDNEECLYFDQLASLNHSVLAWIKQHVENNSCIDLTPVFKDYEKHMKEIESKYAPKRTENGTVQSIAVFKTPDNVHASPTVPVSVAVANPSSLVFASSTPIQGNTQSAALSFKSGNLFSSSPFVWKQQKDTVSEKKEDDQPPNTNANSEDNEDVQPIPERKTIVEENAFYTTRCKLFFKKGNAWPELGVGMLYLKPSGETTQLLIRMENTTGKVLLNIALSKDLPISRNGKNNVMLVTIPNPPVYSKPAEGDNSLPCTYLIRLKGTEEADDLLVKLKK